MSCPRRYCRSMPPRTSTRRMSKRCNRLVDQCTNFGTPPSSSRTRASQPHPCISHLARVPCSERVRQVENVRKRERDCGRLCEGRHTGTLFTDAPTGRVACATHRLIASSHLANLNMESVPAQFRESQTDQTTQSSGFESSDSTYVAHAPKQTYVQASCISCMKLGNPGAASHGLH